MKHIALLLCICSLVLSTVAWAEEGAHLGVMLGTVDKDVSKRLGYEGTGAYVPDVVKDGPAYEAGIRDDDIIIGFDKDTVVGPGHLKDLLALRKPGETVTVTVWRKGKKETFSVKLGKRKLPILGDPEGIAKTIVISGQPRAWLGVRTQELSEQLAEHFGTKDGVLVSEVMEEGPAAKAGLVAGDVIVTVGKEKVESPFALVRALDDLEPGDKVNVVFIRNGKEMTKEVELVETPKKYRRRLPEVFQWRSEGDEPGALSLDFLKGLPQPNLRHFERLELEDDDRMEELRDQLKELRDSLTQEMKALRTELDELRKNLKATN